MSPFHRLTEETLTYTYYSGVHKRWYEPHADSERTLPFLAVVYAHETPFHFITKNSRQIYTAAKDEIVLFPANVTHHYNFQKSGHLSAVHIQYTMLGNLDPLTLFKVPNHFKCEQARKLRTSMFEVIHRNTEPEQTLQAVAERRAWAFRLLADLLGMSSFRHDRLQMMDRFTRIQPVLLHIEKNINLKISREELAHIAHLSLPHFNVVFREATGMAPAYFVQRIRMKKALEILRNSEFSIEQVANFTGFCDPFHFSRQFKKTFGISPSQYRKTLGKNEIAWMPTHHF